MKSYYLLFLFMCYHSISILGQTPTQTIRGIIIDQDSKIPLIGASVSILTMGGQQGTTSDMDGHFALRDVPVGRHSLEVSYLGYETARLENLTLGAGKELVLTIGLQESVIQVAEAVVTAKQDKIKALNEMATLSARSFSVEETQRYAASFLDPARMAQNFAGVSSSGDDLSNEIVIRGNSPAYVQWRLEGIQVPGPNHYANKGSSGGGISMLSNSMLANSDFYTGAFPAEIGNALAGAFDLNFRKGNNQKRENSFQIGVIGIEASTEGPFSAHSDASYLINYRYSTLGLIGKVVRLGDIDLDFQDVSFKVNVPTQKAGVFSLFGLGGLSKSRTDYVPDSTKWENLGDLFSEDGKNIYGLVGLGHRYIFRDKKTYVKTVLAATLDQVTFLEQFIDVRNQHELVAFEKQDLTDKIFRWSTLLNHKVNAKNTLRTGFIFSDLNYSFLNETRDLHFLGNYQFEYKPKKVQLDTKGHTNMYELFAQHRYRPTRLWTLNYGLHYTYFQLTKSSAIEPRFGVKWGFAPKQSLAFSAGLHSQSEHLINYTLQRQRSDSSYFQPNIHLGLTKAAHFVLGYDINLNKSTRLKVETYYQHLFDVPVDTSFIGGTILNAQDVYDVLDDSYALVGEGTGRNIGVDLTLERFFNNSYYYLVTGSLFDSSFKDVEGEIHSTRYNSRFNLTILGGKEFKVGRSKHHTISTNGKLVYNGGNRYHEWDFENRKVTEGGVFKLQADPYFRVDFAINYRVNRSASTHTLALELQNLTNRNNIGGLYPDFDNKEYRIYYQNGLIPNLNYRVEF